MREIAAQATAAAVADGNGGESDRPGRPRLLEK